MLVHAIAPFLLLVLAAAPLSSGTGICQWIKGHLKCINVAFRKNPAFMLPEPDSNTYFSQNLPKPGVHILCDTFSNWHGYSVTQVRDIAHSLKLTEHSDWIQWSNREEWVFLGYRGTNQQYAHHAAVDGYQINPNGAKVYGDGIYMSPWRDLVVDYAHLASDSVADGRVCYNFAPKRVLSQLLMCALCYDFVCGKASASESGGRGVPLQRIQEAPMEVSGRFDHIHSNRQDTSSQIVYPQPFLKSIRVLCIQAPDQRKDVGEIPELFKFNNLYYNDEKQKMDLAAIVVDPDY